MRANLKNPIYLDFNATTPVDSRVFEAMTPYFLEKFGNASSKTHSYGWDADIAIETARKTIAQSIQALPKEIFFVSGGTEANNLALVGVCDSLKENSPHEKIHIVTTMTEHRAGLDVAKFLEGHGVEVTYIKPDSYGRTSLEAVKKSLQSNTKLVSVIFGNNEIGTINPISEIGNFLTSQGILFHTDAAQAFGQVAIDVQKMGIDLLTLSAHKIYGPKGIGALFVRQMPKRVRISPIIIGGGQEKGLRSGTLNTPLIVGFGKATEVAHNEMKKNNSHVQHLRDELLLNILKIPFAQLNGHPIERLPNNMNITFKGIPNSSLLTELKDIAISTGSACSTGSTEPSHVLQAIGLSDEDCMSTVRISLGRTTTHDEIVTAATKIKDAVFRIKERSF